MPASPPHVSGERPLSRFPCCGVVGVSVLLGVPFDLVWAEFAKSKPGNWKGRTRHGERMEVCLALGYRVNTVIMFDKPTLTKLMRTLNPDRTYMVHLGKHVVTVSAGMVADQDGVVPYELHFARRWRVHSYTVVKR